MCCMLHTCVCVCVGGCESERKCVGVKTGAEVISNDHNHMEACLQIFRSCSPPSFFFSLSLSLQCKGSHSGPDIQHLIKIKCAALLPVNVKSSFFFPLSPDSTTTIFFLIAGSYQNAIPAPRVPIKGHQHQNEMSSSYLFILRGDNQPERAVIGRQL